MNKKIFFFDIDGTLIDCHQGITTMSSDTIYSLRKLKEDGHVIFVATGRNLCFIPESIRNFEFDGFITCNGASVYYQNKKILNKTLNIDHLNLIRSFSSKYDLPYFIETDHTIYTNKYESQDRINFSKKWNMAEETVCHDKNQDDSFHMAMVDFKKLDIINEALSIFTDDLNILLHPNQYSADVSLKNVTKGQAIKFICEYLMIDINHTVAFGDGPNDIEMFETVNLALAMGNAIDNLKDKADDVLLSIDNDGVYHGLKKYNFI